MTTSIPVTTRGGKGSSVTHVECSQNFTDLARIATETQSGNVQLADYSETVNSSGGDNVVQAQHLSPAISSLLSGMSDADLSNQGYWTDPRTGFTVQWHNSLSIPIGGTSLWTFPKAFTTGCYFAMGFRRFKGGDEPPLAVPYGALTTTSATLAAFLTDGVTSNALQTRCIAIGF